MYESVLKSMECPAMCTVPHISIFTEETQHRCHIRLDYIDCRF